MKRTIFILMFFAILYGCKETDDPITQGEMRPYALEINEGLDIERPIDSYNYPITPGMPEWNELKTSEELFNACQIDAAITKRMSTEALVQALIEWPFIVEAAALPNYIPYLESKLNCYIELRKRSDVASVLARYHTSFTSLYTGKQVYLVYEGFTAICAQPEYVSQYTMEESKAMLAHMLGYLSDPERSTYSACYFAYLGGRILEKWSNSDENIRNIIDSCMTTGLPFISSEEKELIFEAIREFLK